MVALAMRLPTLFTVFLAFLFTLQLGADTQLWKGKLDAKGRFVIPYSIPKDKPLFIEAVILFDNHWRKVKVFYDDKQIWTDLGPTYKDIEYKVSLFSP